MKPTTLIALTVFALSGCVLDTIVDCRNMCERYQECIDSSSDVEACTSRCETRVDEGDEDQADACDRCLDDNPECATAATLCAADCSLLAAP